MLNKIIGKIKGSISKEDKSFGDHGANSKTDIHEAMNVNNREAYARQRILLQFIVLGVVVVVAGLIIFTGEKIEEKGSGNNEEIDFDVSNIDLPDKNLDTEKRWRNYFERMRKNDRQEFENQIKGLKKHQEDSLKKANEYLQIELESTKAKLDAAKNELMDANGGLKRALEQEEQRKKLVPEHEESRLEVQEFGSNIEYDKPKSAVNYIPEGTYFTGHLLGGVVVSTALNTPDQNATPVVIRLQNGSTNLSKLNKLDLSQCKIMGSAYGDLSSERAVVRLERMVCHKNGMYITSKISGQIYGPDGYNGVKGTVVSTGIKHLKGAAIGGFISGVSGAAGGEDNQVSLLGISSQKTPKAADALRSGGFRGAKNVGEKIAEYYLKQAESMFPVLTIPPGARVQAQITRGFHVGEISTHKKIRDAKK